MTAPTRTTTPGACATRPARATTPRPAPPAPPPVPAGLTFDHAVDYDADERIDPSVQCTSCDAVCCRLTVVLMPEDRIPPRFTTLDPGGLEVMAHGDDGWCVCLDRVSMNCSIYESRPTICRTFAMGSAYCREEREAYANPPADLDGLSLRLL